MTPPRSCRGSWAGFPVDLRRIWGRRPGEPIRRQPVRRWAESLPPGATAATTSRKQRAGNVFCGIRVCLCPGRRCIGSSGAVAKHAVPGAKGSGIGGRDTVLCVHCGCVVCVVVWRVIGNDSGASSSIAATGASEASTSMTATTKPPPPPEPTVTSADLPKLPLSLDDVRDIMQIHAGMVQKVPGDRRWHGKYSER
jgi:hypothetical protein